MVNLSAGRNEVLRLGEIPFAEQEAAQIARIEAQLARIDAAEAYLRAHGPRSARVHALPRAQG